MLYPAITYPHKNHAVLVAALALTQGIQLVLTGGAASMEAELSESIAHAGLTDRVRRLGRLSAADFSHVFAGASALVFPSRYEGFGLPVLEAMALQVPVLASKATALTEVVGDSGWLLDPEDPVAWAAAIVAVLHEPATVAALVGSGRARAAMYTPQRTAQALGEAYWRAAETRRAS